MGMVEEFEHVGARTPRGAALWGAWTAATALGWAAAGACIAIAVPGSASTLQYAFVPLSAVGQWLLLRRHFAQAGWWLVATAGGSAVAALAYAFLMSLPASLLGPVTSGVRIGLSTVVDGLALGTAQWLVLRQNVRGLARWIPATGVPLWLWALAELNRGFEASPAEVDALTLADRVGLMAINLGFVGLLIGALTGGVLAWMVDQPRAWEEA
jgi:hypothetical protein